MSETTAPGEASPADTPPGKRPAYPVAEALAALVVTLPLAISFRLPTLWFLVPFAIITVTNRRYEDYGLSWRNPGRLGFHFAVAGVIFGGYALLHYGFARVVFGASFTPTLPPDLLNSVFTQLIVIGLSEEFFFRGYLQTHLNQRFERRFTFLGARFGWGLILAALIFGLCHVVTGDLTRMRTFFFGLFAGWLRERTDTIAVPAAYHGFANLLYEFMARSMRAA